VSDPVPKAGVFAVRQGPVLARNLSGVGADVPLARYRPQRWWLSLISLGARRAVASYGALAWQGAWVWCWKDAIDRRFVRGG
jgi:selenide,water dikinase